jgi:hypothetical protein
LTPVVVEVPTSAATFRPVEGESNALGADLAIVIRVRNPQGEVIDKMSQRYELRTTPEQLEPTKAGRIIFYRQPDLPAGVYSIETVVRDALADKSSVRFTTVEVPATDPSRLRLSSLVLVRRGEKVPAGERITDSPLYVGDTLLYPDLAASLKRSVDKELGFYLTVYVPDANAQQTATVDLIQNGAVLARLPLELEPPDAERRIRQVGRLPIDQLAAGSYELRVVVHQGDTTVSRTSQFRIAE